jgi:hypothetical protein
MLFVSLNTPIIALLTFREEKLASKASFSGPLSVGRAFLFLGKGGEKDDEGEGKDRRGERNGKEDGWS